MKRVCSILCALALLVTFFAAAAPNARAADWEYTFHGNVDHTEYFIITSNPADKIREARIYSGEIPGMELNVAGEVTLGLAGVPSKVGSYTVFIHMETDHLGDVDIKVTVNINPPLTSDTPKVTKDPTDETVKPGESAWFVAKHTGAILARWHFVSPQGEDFTYSDDEVKQEFPQMKIVNGDQGTMQLQNIPLNANGWKVYCRYSNNSGTADTKSATITVQGATQNTAATPAAEAAAPAGTTTTAADTTAPAGTTADAATPAGTTTTADTTADTSTIDNSVPVVVVGN